MKTLIWRAIFICSILFLTTGMSKKAEITLLISDNGLPSFSWGGDQALRLGSFTVSRLIFSDTSFDREVVWRFIAGSDSAASLESVSYGKTPDQYREITAPQALRANSIYEVACSGEANGTVFFFKVADNSSRYCFFRQLQFAGEPKVSQKGQAAEVDVHPSKPTQ